MWITPTVFLILLLLIGCQSKTSEHPIKTTRPVANAEQTTGLTEQEDLLNLPSPPSDVRLILTTKNSQSQAVLVWNGTRDDTISGYNVYLLNTPKDWSLISFITLRKEDSRNRGEYQFSKDISAKGTYAVAAVNSKGTPGPKSAAVHR